MNSQVVISSWKGIAFITLREYQLNMEMEMIILV